ncbi:MAG: class I SAM-dependent methyltransferase [Gammaproteobacteria bacterium]
MDATRRLPMQVLAERVARDPRNWTDEARRAVRHLFDRLASEWPVTSDGHPAGEKSLQAAYDRGGITAPGVCLELGSGTGLYTSWLRDRHRIVIAADISAAMLARSHPDVGLRLQCDGAALPVADQTIDVIVVINGLLFPSEMLRVLSSRGLIVVVATDGPDTPLYVPPATATSAFGREWNRVEGDEATSGTWYVLRRK